MLVSNGLRQLAANDRSAGALVGVALGVFQASPSKERLGECFPFALYVQRVRFERLASDTELITAPFVPELAASCRTRLPDSSLLSVYPPRIGELRLR